MAIPDVVSDNITDACKRAGLEYSESLFFRYALYMGFGQQAERKARELDQLWKRKGYKALPGQLKDFVLKICAGEKHEEVIASKASAD